MRAPTIATIVATCTTIAALAGCSRSDRTNVAAPSTAAAAAATSPSAPVVCSSADSHTRHAQQGIACATCHACAGRLVLGSYTFPGGTTSTGDAVTQAGGATTCSVGCHRPFGATSQPVTWNSGPLACTSCHSNVTGTLSGPTVSSHVATGGSLPSCGSCHDTSRHTSGTVLLLTGDGSSVAVAPGGSSAEGTCTGCHAGQGATLAGQTPRLLVGWSDALAGDFHGPRPGTCRFDGLDAAGQRSVGTGALPCPSMQPDAPDALRITSRWWYVSGLSGPWAWTCDIETVDASGNRIAPTLVGQPCPQGTVLNSACNDPRSDPDCRPTTLVVRGFGGTLRAPYTRGRVTLPCAACHDFHASANAFLLAGTVNGTAIPPGTIDRAGVGAQALCNACHDGDRHEVCRSCHKETWTTDGEYSWFEGAPVDPVPDGSPCFYCHGHEGIRFMLVSSPAYPGGGHPFGLAYRNKADPACSHCHSAWAPPPVEYVAPKVTPDPPTLTGLTATTATLTWQTSEPATTYVEYGVGTAGIVVGDAAFVTAHAVTLTNLLPGTTYVWRVLDSDRFRNFTETSLQSFTTPAANAVPAPDLAPVDASAQVGTYSRVVALTWFPVTAPSGTAVQYEVQLASDPAFTSLSNASMVSVPGTAIGDSGWVSGSAATSGGKPALTYPATLTNIPQDTCGDIVPNVYYWRVRARDAAGNVSGWSTTGTFGVFAGDPWC